MDRQEKKKNDGGSSENGSDNGSHDESDNEEKVGILNPSITFYITRTII